MQNPCKHIAEILLKKSEEIGETPGGAKGVKVQLDGPVSIIKDAPAAASGVKGDQEMTHEFKTADAELPAELDAKLKAFFDKMDADGNGHIDKDEAMKFWGKNFAKVNANAMFNELDVDKNGEVSKAEWLEFWQNVLAHKYTAEEVEEEVDMMMEGGSWVDWNDGRTT